MADDGRARLGRRQVLRLGGALALAAAVGCAPERPQRASRWPAPGDTGSGATAAADAPSEDPRAAGPGSLAPRDDAAPVADPPDELDGTDGPSDTERAAQPGAVAVVEVLCRDALGLAAAAAGGRPHRLRRLTLHHSGLSLTDVAGTPAQLRRHQGFHREQGWSDIAYHFAVDLRGNVYELRDPAVAGDTFTAYDPTGHLGVVCEGDFDQQQPTDAMLEGAALLVAHAATAYGLAPRSLAGHGEHAPTRCPGTHLAARLAELRARVDRLTVHGVERRDVCGAAGRARVAAITRGG